MKHTDNFVFLDLPITNQKLIAYIADNKLTSDYTLLLNQLDLDDFALKYRTDFHESLPNPYILLDVLISEQTDGTCGRGFIEVIRSDSISQRSLPPQRATTNVVVHRCGYCGNFVNSEGNELSGYDLAQTEELFDRSDRTITVRHKYGYCCRHEYYNESPSVPAPFDESRFVSSVTLAELMDSDFAELGLDRVKTHKYDVMYVCSNRRSAKLYFTPNEQSYSVRGHLLEEIQEVFTAQQLLAVIRAWQRQ